MQDMELVLPVKDRLPQDAAVERPGMANSASLTGNTNSMSGDISSIVICTHRLYFNNI